MKLQLSPTTLATVAFVAGAAAGAAATISILAQRSGNEAVGFRPSDVQLVASTGTPQLVEFFHPD